MTKKFCLVVEVKDIVMTLRNVLIGNYFGSYCILGLDQFFKPKQLFKSLKDLGFSANVETTKRDVFELKLMVSRAQSKIIAI